MNRKDLTNSDYPRIDQEFLERDKEIIKTTKNIKSIPNFSNRLGGKMSYAEWAHVIGIFQTLIYQTIRQKSGNHILDVGCGTGLVGISANPYVSNGGSYTGIDIQERDILFCRKHYTEENYNFIHVNKYNRTYNRAQTKESKPWSVGNHKFDLVTGLSVWTHFREEDAIFYLKEVSRVLKKGGRAIITFFRLDEYYTETLSDRKEGEGRFHGRRQERFIFDSPAYGSSNWFAPSWTNVPEVAIGVTNPGIDLLLNESGLKLVNYFPGNWKEKPGIFFQDILVFEK